MKLLVLNYEYPPIGGGAGKISRQTAIHLHKLGHGVTVLTAWFKGTEEEYDDNGVRVIRLKSSREKQWKSNPLEMLSWMKLARIYLEQHLQQNKYDFCLANFSIPGGWVARRVFRNTGLPYAVVSHGQDIPWMYKRQMFFFHLPLYFFIRKICRDSALNFIQSKDMKANIDRFLGKKHAAKNILIPNGLDRALCIGSIRRKEEFTLLFSGRMVGQKDPMTMLYSLKRLMSMEIPFQAIIMGDGPLRAKMEKYVKKTFPQGNVRFTGWLPETEVLENYSRSHVLIQPSRFEGMSISALEALGCGLYVVGTQVSGYEDMFEVYPHGKLVQRGNYLEIANYLQKIYFEKVLSQNWNGEGGYDEFVRKFDWLSIAGLYSEVISRNLGVQTGDPARKAETSISVSL